LADTTISQKPRSCSSSAGGDNRATWTSSSVYEEYDLAHRSSERIKVRRACEESVQLLSERQANGTTIPTTTSINQIKRRIIAKLFSGGKGGLAGASGQQDSPTSSSGSGSMDLGDRVYAAERITKKRVKRVRVETRDATRWPPGLYHLLLLLLLLLLLHHLHLLLLLLLHVGQAPCAPIIDPRTRRRTQGTADSRGCHRPRNKGSAVLEPRPESSRSIPCGKHETR
jgi:hypothetical protein